MVRAVRREHVREMEQHRIQPHPEGLVYLSWPLVGMATVWHVLRVRQLHVEFIPRIAKVLIIWKNAYARIALSQSMVPTAHS